MNLLKKKCNFWAMHCRHILILCLISGLQFYELESAVASSRACEDFLKQNTYDEAYNQWVDLAEAGSRTFQLHMTQIETWHNPYNDFFKHLTTSNLSSEQILESFDGIIQALVYAAHYQWIHGPSELLKQQSNEILALLSKALNTEDVALRRIQQTVKVEWQDRLSGLSAMSVSLDKLKKRVTELKSFLQDLKDNKDKALSTIDFTTIDFGFFIYDLIRELQSKENVDANALTTFNFLPHIKNFHVSSSEVVGALEIAKESSKWHIWADDKYQADAVLHLILVELLLAKKTSTLAKLSPEHSEVLRLIQDLMDLDFSDFFKSFPSKTQYSEHFYRLGAKGDFERAIIDGIFKEKDFKKILFQKSPPPLDPSLLHQWVNYASAEQTYALLLLLENEDEKIKQIGQRYLKESTYHGLKELIAEPSLVEAYADDILEALIRLSNDTQNRLKNSELKNLIQRKEELTARFFSRRPRDLTLGKATGDCTSMRGLNFSNSIRWFANTSGQVMTFSINGSLLAKAHLVLFSDSLLIDAFEINPLAEEGKPLHDLLKNHIQEMFNIIKKIGDNLNRKTYASRMSNSEFINNYVEHYKTSVNQALFSSHFILNVPPIIDYLESTTGLMLLQRSFINSMTLPNFIYFQSATFDYLDAIDDETSPLFEKALLTSKTNRQQLINIESEYEDSLRNYPFRMPKELKAYRFADLLSNDRHLSEFDRIVQGFLLSNEKKLFYEINETTSAIRAIEIAEAFANILMKENLLESDVSNKIRALYEMPDDFDDDIFLVHRLVYLYFYKRFDTVTASPIGSYLDKNKPMGWITHQNLFEL